MGAPIMHYRCQWLSARLPLRETVTRSFQSTQRTYATSSAAPVAAAPVAVKSPLKRRKGGDLGSHLPKHVIPADAYIPAYPYGDHQLFKQANKGLYGDQRIQFGNNVSHKTETKTRRYWKPNVLSKALYSVVLKKKIKLRVTANIMKIIDREGGLDEYLLKDSEHRIKELGPMGWALRWTLMQRPEVVARLRAQAAALGIDQAIIDKQWPTPEMMAERKAALSEHAREEQARGLEQHNFAETAEQQMWEPDNLFDAQGVASTPTPNRGEGTLAVKAAAEYTKVTKAARRYLRRGLVDSEEEGLKLAFVRESLSDEATRAFRQAFARKLEDVFTLKDVQEIRTRFKLPNISDQAARQIAYDQQKREQIKEAGSVAAWRDSLPARYPETATFDKLYMTLEEKKARYAHMIAEAETASTNTSLDAERRAFLEVAMGKADNAIRANTSGGKQAYVDLLLSQAGESRASSKDAWATLVASSNASSQKPLTV